MQVLALANLRRCVTHSTQTAGSAFRVEGTTQTWLPKDSSSQTGKSRGQTLPKKVQYVGGLRGPPATKMSVLNLELDLGQPQRVR
jgi:hypothetical protein